MAKHMLRVAEQPFTEPPEHIYMKCDHCPKYLKIERKTMESILTKRSDHDAWHSAVIEKWKKCEGYGDPYPKTDLRFGS